MELRRTLVFLMGTCSTLLLAGCMHEHVVTSDPKYPTDYLPGGCYELKEDVFLVHVGRSPKNPLGEREPFDVGWSVVLPGDPAMPTMEAFKLNPMHYESPYYFNLLPAGTRIRFLFLGHSWSPMIDGVEAYGRILDGSLANTTIALGALSSRKNEPLAAPRMNERYLKFQSQPAQ